MYDGGSAHSFHRPTTSGTYCVAVNAWGSLPSRTSLAPTTRLCDQNDSIDTHAYPTGVANAGLVSQSGAHVLINLGRGNVATVEATTADVLSHIVW